MARLDRLGTAKHLAQLGAVLGNLMDIGHAYMSTLRLADDVTDFAGNVRGLEAFLLRGFSCDVKRTLCR